MSWELTLLALRAIAAGPKRAARSEAARSYSEAQLREQRDGRSRSWSLARCVAHKDCNIGIDLHLQTEVAGLTLLKPVMYLR